MTARAYQIRQRIAGQQGVDRIRMCNRQGRLVYSNDAREQTNQVPNLSNECAGSGGDETRVTSLC